MLEFMILLLVIASLLFCAGVALAILVLPLYAAIRLLDAFREPHTPA